MYFVARAKGIRKRLVQFFRVFPLHCCHHECHIKKKKVTNFAIRKQLHEILKHSFPQTSYNNVFINYYWNFYTKQKIIKHMSISLRTSLPLRWPPFSAVCQHSLSFQFLWFQNSIIDLISDSLYIHKMKPELNMNTVLDLN